MSAMAILATEFVDEKKIPKYDAEEQSEILRSAETLQTSFVSKTSIPIEIILHIFSFLKPNEVVINVYRTCKVFYLLSKKDIFWTPLLNKHFPQITLTKNSELSIRQQVKIIFHRFRCEKAQLDRHIAAARKDFEATKERLQNGAPEALASAKKKSDNAISMFSIEVINLKKKYDTQPFIDYLINKKIAEIHSSHQLKYFSPETYANLQEHERNLSAEDESQFPFNSNFKIPRTVKWL